MLAVKIAVSLSQLLFLLADKNVVFFKILWDSQQETELLSVVQGRINYDVEIHTHKLSKCFPFQNLIFVSVWYFRNSLGLNYIKHNLLTHSLQKGFKRLLRISGHPIMLRKLLFTAIKFKDLKINLNTNSHSPTQPQLNLQLDQTWVGSDMVIGWTHPPQQTNF